MKICAISDTHNKHHQLNIPECDIIIHAGDFSHNEHQFYNFIAWYSSLPIKHKILVAGNHDYTADELGYDDMVALCQTNGIIYLQDTSTVINDIKIHGSPRSNIFGGYPFMNDDFELQEYWDLIPNDTDILITHGPAYTYLDKVNNSYSMDRHAGSRTLAEKVNELKGTLKYHIVGHIHEAHGSMSIGNLTIMNVSMYEYNRELKTPVLFEY